MDLEHTGPSLVFRCRKCGWTRNLPLSLRGKRGRCKSCGQVQRINGPTAEPDARSEDTPAQLKKGTGSESSRCLPPLPTERSPASHPAPILLESGAANRHEDYPLVDEPPAAPTFKPISPAPKPKPASSPRWKAVARSYGGETSQVQGIAVCLLALSLADLFMTYTLLRSGPHFFESNPVAQWFFARWNIAGMALFKLGVMGAVIALGEVIERHRPGWGRLVLAAGCAAAAFAVITGLRLYLHHA